MEQSEIVHHKINEAVLRFTKIVTLSDASDHSHDIFMAIKLFQKILTKNITDHYFFLFFASYHLATKLSGSALSLQIFQEALSKIEVNYPSEIAMYLAILGIKNYQDEIRSASFVHHLKNIEMNIIISSQFHFHQYHIVDSVISYIRRFLSWFIILDESSVRNFLIIRMPKILLLHLQWTCVLPGDLFHEFESSLLRYCKFHYFPLTSTRNNFWSAGLT